jgi:hypothetical protein
MEEVAKTDWLVIWTAVYAIATVILAGGIWIAIRQIREARRNTQAQIAMDFFRELRSDRALEILRYIYDLTPNEDGKYLTTKHKYDIEYVLDRFDVLGVLVADGFIDDKLAIDAYAGVTALRCWYQLHQYVWRIRGKRKYFGDNFEAFTNRCLTYFDRAYIEVGFENPYVTEEDLVKKLKDSEKENDETKKKLYPRTLKEIRKQRRLQSK